MNEFLGQYFTSSYGIILHIITYYHMVTLYKYNVINNMNILKKAKNKRIKKFVDVILVPNIIL